MSKTMLCSSVPGPRILPFTPSARRLGMPRYEFFCHTCKKLFSKILSLVDYEEGEILCPHCSSKEVEQCWSAFNAIMSKKSDDNRVCGRCTISGQLTLPVSVSDLLQPFHR